VTRRSNALDLAGRGSVGLNEFDGAGAARFDGRQELRRQRPEIRKPVRSCPNNDDGNRKRGKILLKGKVSIHCDKHIEMVRGKRQQLTVLIVVQPI
jgi:hypothetical protein